ncbi:GlxA family transcriptional regulator [Roseovarius sp. SCSIO 43702]|uniref:GlxA family transcriptional regulator n=1 Tax=Roseovarius sp. SCSIO 43702 TaxID=2823043 RepID=UPI002175C45C|nr:GlxA family transcriptional regulator [Roseovarius sp. SCSIO 43702]
MSNMDTSGLEPVRIRRIGILPLPGFAALSYASTAEMMRAANLLSRERLYDVVNIGLSRAPMQSSGAVQVICDAQVGDDLDLDYLFVVAGGDPMSFEDRNVLAWLARMARKGIRMGGVSGGPVILARAGLMTGRRMTVHWEHAAALAEMSPQLLIERSLYVIDRDRVTCAGGTAPIDLMHALIARHHGAPFARLVSDWFMHTEVRPSAGPQRGGLVDRVGCNVPAILDAVEMMESHIADPVALGDLAATAGVSARQLNRLFQERLGRSTMGYYRDLRLETARALLRNAPLSLTEIALATGFANSSHFSKVYAKAFGEPPSAYR